MEELFLPNSAVDSLIQIFHEADILTLTFKAESVFEITFTVKEERAWPSEDAEAPAGVCGRPWQKWRRGAGVG